MAKGRFIPPFEDCTRCRNLATLYCRRCSIGEHFKERVEELNLDETSYETPFGWESDTDD